MIEPVNAGAYIRQSKQSHLLSDVFCVKYENAVICP
jgi:hypothetical protein